MAGPFTQARFIVGALATASEVKDIVASRTIRHQHEHPEVNLYDSVMAVLDDLTFIESCRVLGAPRRAAGVADKPIGQGARAVSDLLFAHAQEVVGAAA